MRLKLVKRAGASAPPAQTGTSQTPYLSRRSRAAIVAVIIGCIVGVAALSFFFLNHLSMRLDESQSLWQSSHSLPGVLHTVALDVHVPLYHLILHFWLYYFGDNISHVRMLSLLFFVATIPVIYLLSRELLPRRWALLTVILFSFSPFLNWYANEARMYTLLLLMSALNQLFFIRIMRTGKGWLWFGLTAVIGAYSHYFFMFNLAAEGLFFIVYRRRFGRGALVKMVAVALAVVAAISPWLYYFKSLGSASGTRPHLPVPSTVDFFNAYSQFVFGFQGDFINTLILSAWPVAMLLALIAVRRSRGVPVQFKFVTTMSVLPVLLAYVISLVITPFFLSRYMVIAVAPLCIMLMYLFSYFRRRLATICVCILFILTIVTSYLQITSSKTPVKEDYRAAATAINASVKPQDLVVLSAPFTIYPFEYYYRGNAQIATLPNWQRGEPGAIPNFDKATLPAQVAAMNKNHRYIYLVLSQDQGYEKTIADYYLSHFKQVSRTSYSPDLTVYVYKVGFYTVPVLGSPETVQPL